jgi:hypothetical protein
MISKYIYTRKCTRYTSTVLLMVGIARFFGLCSSFGILKTREHNGNRFKKSIIFWDITPCSPLSVNRHFGGTYHLHLQVQRNKFSKKPASKQASRWQAMEAICSSETSVNTERNARRYIPEDDTLHNHRCENLKSYEADSVFETLYSLVFRIPDDGQSLKTQ